MNQLLFIFFIIATLLQNVNGFHERVAGGAALSRNANSSTSRNERVRGHCAIAENLVVKDRVGSHHQDTTRTTPSALYASRQFRNVEEMLDSFREELVLINFMAVNCGPCRLQKKELATVSRSVGNSLHMLAIDTNRWPSVSSRFEVGKLPCLVAFKNGQILFRLEGYTKAEDVVERLRSVQEQHQYQ